MIAKANLRIILNFDILIHNKKIRVHIEYKKSLKNVYLRIINNKTLQIKANEYFSLRDAKNFVKSKEKWIQKHLSKSLKNALQNNEFYFLGEIQEKDTDNFDVDAYYKKEAICFLPSIVEEYAKKMSLFPSALKFRKNKTRWGSCSHKNIISLNTHLMKFPLAVIIYVIIHELAHIKHKNHSKSFWLEVERYCINYKDLNAKLKEY